MVLRNIEQKNGNVTQSVHVYWNPQEVSVGHSVSGCGREQGEG